MKLSEYARQTGIKYQTAWKHYQKGLIPGAYQLETGTIIVPDSALGEQKRGPRQVAVYARVSSSENKGNLATQAERIKTYCAARGYQITKVVKEVGSGVNDKRPQFLSLLADESIDVIVVEHRDRATRFGFTYLETLLAQSGRELEVINSAENDKEELMQDLISIVTSFVAGYYGQRRAKRKTEQIIKELQDG